MFRVFRLDFEGVKGKWVEIKSLGEASLFLGDNSSISVLASNFAGCQPNCIYFTHDEDGLLDTLFNIVSVCDLGIYEVESKSFKFHYTMDLAALKMARRPPIWVVPTPNIS